MADLLHFLRISVETVEIPEYPFPRHRFFNCQQLVVSSEFSETLFVCPGHDIFFRDPE